MTRTSQTLHDGRAGLGGVRRAAHHEDGYVIVVVLALLTVALLIGAAGLGESLSSRSHANLDTREHRALQAADAGVQAVLYRENQLDLGSLNLSGGSGAIPSLLDCLVPDLSNTLPGSHLIARSISSGGACPVGQWHGADGTAADDAPFSTAVPVGNHDSYNAEFIPNAATVNSTSGIGFVGAKIVSVGIDDNGHVGDPHRYVYERVEVTATSLIQATSSGWSSGWNSTWIEPFMMLEANHDLTFQVPAATAFNGTARIGHKLFFDLQSSLVSTFVGTNILNGGSIIERSSIDVGCPGNAGPNNAYTFENKPALSTFLPTVLGGFNVANPQTCSAPYWFNRPVLSISHWKLDCPSSSSCSSLTGYSNTNGTQHEIFINNGAQLNLAPGDYVFCSFQTNGPVNVTASNNTAPVRIFVDSPNSSRCSGFQAHPNPGPPPGLPSGFQTGAGSFVAQQGIGGLIGGVVTTLSPAAVQVYVVGDGTPDDTVATSGPVSAANGFFMTAPSSKVTVSSLVALTGAMIGYDVTVNTILYNQALSFGNYSGSISGASSGSSSGSTSGNSYGLFRPSQYVQCTNTLSALTGTIATDTAGC
jgi:hypothetical protein